VSPVVDPRGRWSMGINHDHTGMRCVKLSRGFITLTRPKGCMLTISPVVLSQVVIRRLGRLGEGERVDPDTMLELDTAELLALDLGRKVERAQREDVMEDYRSR
jgi:hypothetical protein